MKRILSFYMGLLLVQSAGASQAYSISDQILKDYNSSKSFREWIGKLTEHSYPGDNLYFEKLWVAYPDLAKDPTLPKLIFEKKQFIIRSGPSEATLQMVEKTASDFLINGQTVSIHRYDLPSERMKKILDSTKSRKSAHIVLMPVVWAAERGEPTKIDTTVSALVSALMSSQIQLSTSGASSYQSEIDDGVQGRIGSDCLLQIHQEEKKYSDADLMISKMTCQGSKLVTELAGESSDSKKFALESDENIFSILTEQNGKKNRYQFQRANTWKALTPKDQAGIEYINRFEVAAEGKELCRVCPKETNEYASVKAKVFAKHQQVPGIPSPAKTTK